MKARYAPAWLRLFCAILISATPSLIAGCGAGQQTHDPYADDVDAILGDRAADAPPAVAPADSVARRGLLTADRSAGTPVVTAAWVSGEVSPVSRTTGLSAVPALTGEAADLNEGISDAPTQPLWNARPNLRTTFDEPGTGLAGRQLAAAPTEPPVSALDEQPAGSQPPSEEPGPMRRLANEDRPLDTFGATVLRDIKAAPGELWRDTKNVMTIENALVLLAAGGASAMSRWVDADQSLDTTVAKHYEAHHSMPRDWNESFGFLGNPITHFGLAAAAYAYSVLAKDQDTYSVSKTLMSALIINGVTTMALKVAVLDDRSPNGENFAWPSGHTSSAFTVAAVLEVSYGWKVGLPAYGIAALAGLQRLDTREHWLSDVIFGAALGIVIGRSVAKGRMPEVAGWSVLPYADGNGGGGVVLLKQQ